MNRKNSKEPGGKIDTEKKSKEEMPSSIDMPSNENKKRSMKEHIDNSLIPAFEIKIKDNLFSGQHPSFY